MAIICVTVASSFLIGGVRVELGFLHHFELSFSKILLVKVVNLAERVLKKIAALGD